MPTCPPNQSSLPARVRVVIPCSVMDYHVLQWCAGSAGCSVAELVRKALYVSCEVWRGQVAAKAKGVEVPADEAVETPAPGQAKDKCDIVLDLDARTVGVVRVRAKAKNDEDLRRALAGEVQWYLAPKRELMRQHGMLA